MSGPNAYYDPSTGLLIDPDADVSETLLGSSRPDGDAVGTRTASASGEKGKTASTAPRPDVVEGFDVIESEERDENAIADEVLAYVLAHGGTVWNKVDNAVSGKGDRLRASRDNLLAGGRLVNLGSEARMKLWHADDPALPAIESLVGEEES